jgi:hypothetical protein
MTELRATFEVQDWEEQPFDEADGAAKLTRASVSKTYAGDITGRSVTEWLMAYSPDGSAAFVGIERITGSLGDRDGSIVVRHVGTYEDGAATAELEVLSGTGDLAAIGGRGELVADPGGRVTLRLTSAPPSG